MKERQILFSAPMVRAILAGRKTQTRRAINLRQTPYHSIETRGDGAPWPWRESAETSQDFWYPCPYGQPGDRLYVREAWAPHPDFPESTRRVIYRADHECEHDVPRWRPSIHMPRWANRITLEVTGVRVERLQDISEADCIAEGIQQHGMGMGWATEARFPDGKRHFGASAYDLFRQLWESINGASSWDANPWVWVVEFRHTGRGGSIGATPPTGGTAS